MTKDAKPNKKDVVYQVKDGSWVSKKFKTLRAAKNLYHGILDDRSQDGSRDTQFCHLSILKNGKPLRGYE